MPIDATEPHTYAVRWSSEQVEFSVDDKAAMTSDQRLDYEQQLMIGLFEFPISEQCDPQNYPKTARIHSVVGVSR